MTSPPRHYHSAHCEELFYAVKSLSGKKQREKKWVEFILLSLFLLKSLHFHLIRFLSSFILIFHMNGSTQSKKYTQKENLRDERYLRMIIKIHYKAIPISTNYRLPTHSLRSKTKNGTICDGDSPPNFVLSTRASLLLFFLYPTQETEQVQLRWSKWFVTSLFLTSTLQLLFKRFIFLLLNHFYFCFDGVSKDLIPNGRVHVAKGNWLHEKKKNSTGLFFCVVFLAKWTHVYPRADYTTDLNGYEGSMAT